MDSVSKRFPGMLAVDRVSFEVRAGEVHALMGENGAGKSTLMKVLAGAFNDYTGTVSINGRQVRLHTPAAARKSGVGMIYQELSLSRPASIAENLLAGALPVKAGFVLDRRAMKRKTREALQRVGLDLDPDLLVEDISLHEAQLVEIAKVLDTHPSILVMDEPTSALSREEVSRLFEIIRDLRRQGLAIIYISHHLPEVFEIADRVTVMRDGKLVGTRNLGDTSREQLVEMMIGGAVSDMYAERTVAGKEVKLKAESLSRYGFFHDVSFSVNTGEILGICGLCGAGRSELVRSMCGIDPLDEGCLYMNDEDITPDNYTEAIVNGLAYLTEDRKEQGLALRMSIGENTMAAIIPRLCTAGVYRASAGIANLGRLIHDLQIYPPIPEQEVANLSGGNQQKVLMAKWLATDPEVLILDEPTRGVDVGAKVVIHTAIAELANRGKSVILISSDLPELVGLSDRIVVMRKGHVIGELPSDKCTEENALLAANGELTGLI
jgi:ribose transport system ATP-binding protein